MANKHKLWLIDQLLRHQGYGKFPLAWNVKVYGFKLDWEHLVEKYHEAAGPDILDAFPKGTTVGQVRSLYERDEEEINSKLWEWAIEDMRQEFSEGPGSTWWETPSGRSITNLEFGFDGRSGGWLVITRYYGSLTDRDMWAGRIDFEQHLKELSYEQVIDLYTLVGELDGYCTSETLEDELVYQAAYPCFDTLLPMKLREELAERDRLVALYGTDEESQWQPSYGTHCRS